MAAILHMNFPEMKLKYFARNLIKIHSQRSKWQQDSIGANHGIALHRWHATIWNNDDLVFNVL